ncbi:M50 family metallopeptidase [Massiliimalia massiliensis]|uniref:M50 family metallopeptidase n=1 Tax=Massiliimalia massiliensis TaxID=1852384 RepID=UPI001E53F5D6|nr:M50 family metallopeptidase [Massiliimalia massiliensis]
MNLAVTILLTILVFGIIIMIHELGHFIVAKLCGVRVLEFSMGMGPAIYTHQKKSDEVELDPDTGEMIPVNHNTKYSVRILPIGGYVSMEGEDSTSADERAFCNKPVWKRFCIVVAGAVMNLLLGFLVLLGVVLTMSHVPTRQVASFNENAVSAQYGLAVGDEILKVNGRAAFTYDDVVTEILGDDDGIIDFQVKRNGEKLELKEVEFYTEVTGEKRELDIDFKLLAEENSLGKSLSYSAGKALSLGRLVWISLGDLITGKVGFDQLSGPVGVGEAIGQAVSISWTNLFILIAFLTINVGIFNLLPIPALDGGRLVFILIEAIFRKPVPAKYEGVIHAVGLILLFGLMIVITLKDIIRLF